MLQNIDEPCSTNQDCEILGLNLLPGYGLSLLDPICVDMYCSCAEGYGFGNVLGVLELVCVRL